MVHSAGIGDSCCGVFGVPGYLAGRDVLQADRDCQYLAFINCYLMNEWIDIAIPGVGGVLLVLMPNWFIRRPNRDSVYFARSKQLRRMGLVLLSVAAMFWWIKLAGGN